MVSVGVCFLVLGRRLALDGHHAYTNFTPPTDAEVLKIELLARMSVRPAELAETGRNLPLVESR